VQYGSKIRKFRVTAADFITVLIDCKIQTFLVNSQKSGYQGDNPFAKGFSPWTPFLKLINVYGEATIHLDTGWPHTGEVRRAAADMLCDLNHGRAQDPGGHGPPYHHRWNSTEILKKEDLVATGVLPVTSW
jgi:hypothetical protein